jgi:hypothetical protein
LSFTSSLTNYLAPIFEKTEGYSESEYVNLLFFFRLALTWGFAFIIYKQEKSLAKDLYYSTLLISSILLTSSFLASSRFLYYTEVIGLILLPAMIVKSAFLQSFLKTPFFILFYFIYGNIILFSKSIYIQL